MAVLCQAPCGQGEPWPPPTEIHPGRCLWDGAPQRLQEPSPGAPALGFCERVRRTRCNRFGEGLTPSRFPPPPLVRDPAPRSLRGAGGTRSPAALLHPSPPQTCQSSAPRQTGPHHPPSRGTVARPLPDHARAEGGHPSGPPRSRPAGPRASLGAVVRELRAPACPTTGTGRGGGRERLGMALGSGCLRAGRGLLRAAGPRSLPARGRCAGGRVSSGGGGPGPSAALLPAGQEGRCGPGRWGRGKGSWRRVTVPSARLAAAGLRVPLRRGRGAGAGQPGGARRPPGLPEAVGRRRAAPGARRLPHQRRQLPEVGQGPRALPGAGAAGKGGRAGGEAGWSSTALGSGFFHGSPHPPRSGVLATEGSTGRRRGRRRREPTRAGRWQPH